jgi:hypothetical protein
LPGLVQDTLIDGVYVAFSSRGGTATRDGSNNVWKVVSSIVRLDHQLLGPRADHSSTACTCTNPDWSCNAATDPRGHGTMFKLDQWSPRFNLTNNLFVCSQPYSASSIEIDPTKVLACANNIFVWLGHGKAPALLPRNCFSSIVEADAVGFDVAYKIFTDARDAWKLRHPEVTL